MKTEQTQGLNLIVEAFHIWIKLLPTIDTNPQLFVRITNIMPRVIKSSILAFLIKQYLFKLAMHFDAIVISMFLQYTNLDINLAYILPHCEKETA